MRPGAVGGLSCWVPGSPPDQGGTRMPAAKHGGRLSCRPGFPIGDAGKCREAPSLRFAQLCWPLLGSGAGFIPPARRNTLGPANFAGPC
ncbi:hypothetical protein HRbin36_02896 [bacterium HR36]|nr:hypothetical protein HRbin36_02896 [bacterium HR36]